MAGSMPARLQEGEHPTLMHSLRCLHLDPNLLTQDRTPTVTTVSVKLVAVHSLHRSVCLHSAISVSLPEPYHTLGSARRFRKIIADPYVPLRVVA